VEAMATLQMLLVCERGTERIM